MIDHEHGAVIRDVHVVVPTDAFDDDLVALTAVHGFRLDAIFPADSPATAIVSAHGIRLRLDGRAAGGPITLHLLSDDPGDPVVLPGGSRLEFRPFARPYQLPDNRPSLVVSHDDGESGVGRAGMRYRDLVPDRWGGRFIASLITIPEGGPVPDYVHFHNIRFQLIFVKAGWVEVVYEDQGEPFVLHAGDGVLQPPEIRHRVLNSSPGLQVIEIGCPAEHETIADHALTLPTAVVDPDRDFGGQRFVRHIAADATYAPWRFEDWEYRDTGIADATHGLGGVRVARPCGATATPASTTSGTIAHDTEFALLVVLRGDVTFVADGHDRVQLSDGDSVAVPGGLPYLLDRPSDDCELLDVTLPAEFDTRR